MLTSILSNSSAENATDKYLATATQYAGQYKDAGMLYADKYQKYLDANDPNTVAAKRYAEMQQLIQPQRQKDQQALLQQLYNKGGYGLLQNTPTQLGTTPVNPYVDTFLARNAQADKEMQYDAYAQGQKYLDMALGRQKDVWGAEKDATQRYVEALLGYNLNAQSQDALRNSNMYSQIGNAVQGVNWGDLWKKISGMFGYGDK